MGHYAKGDSQRISSSDDEEGYENQTFFTARTAELLSQLNFRDKRYFVNEILGEAPSVPTPPISDDTDRPFWAEDELSSSESTIINQRLSGRRKRRHSLSYRNRVAVHRSRSLLFKSSSSSLDSIRVKISPAVRKRERRSRAAERYDRKQLETGNSITKKRSPCAHNKLKSRSINKKNTYTECQSSTSQRAQENNPITGNKRLNEVRNKFSTSSSSNGSQSYCKTNYLKKN